MELYNQSTKEVLETYSVKAASGLSRSQVETRKHKYGLNELQAKKKVNPLILFLNQFRSFIIYILIFAVIISVISGEYVDAIVILIILLFNAVFGFIQEYKAEKAIDELKKLSGFKVQVLRSGKKSLIETKDLVPGDIVLLEEGNKVPADARIIEQSGLQISESSLTGESVPVSKHNEPLSGEKPIAERKNMVFSGTAVTRGRAKVVITSIGMNTEIGKIADLLSEVQTEMTPLQKKLESLGKWIGSATILICILVFIVGAWKDGLFPILFRGEIVGFILASKDWFLTAVSLAVAAVPEGLPAVVTIALSIGVKRMVKRNALIRRLPSVETLGEATVICSDKTGTLTRNEMTVRAAFTLSNEMHISGEGYDVVGKITGDKALGKDEELLFRIGALCNDASLISRRSKTEVLGDPTEASLLVSAKKAGLDYAKLQKSWKRVHEEPFDSIRKMMSTVYTKGGKKLVFSKGAPEHLLRKCTRVIIRGKVKKLTSSHRKLILSKNKSFAKKALRVLAFAYKEAKGKKLEADLIFVGLQGMIDPPHHEVPAAIKKCTEAGIRVIMITGDNRHTAEAIAKEIGIEGQSMEGAKFAKLTKKQQLRAVKNVSIFSRVEPKHKMQVVELLQKRGHVVAMTGDGVNDAPAISKSDLGIAMGIAGTNVAKESSDMILQDDNFTSIVSAIEEGRGIYENIKKFVNYMLSSNLGEVLVIFGAILLNLPLPMTAIMLLWLNLVTDGLPALALSVDPNPDDLMKRPPKKKKEGIMNRSMAFNVIYVGILITFGVLGVFIWGMKQYAGSDFFLSKIQTLAFTAIIVMEIVRLQAIRSEYKLGIFSNKYLILAVAVSISLQLLVIYTPLRIFFGTTPLNGMDWVAIVVASAGVLVLNIIGEAIKNRIAWFHEG